MLICTITATTQAKRNRQHIKQGNHEVDSGLVGGALPRSMPEALDGRDRLFNTGLYLPESVATSLGVHPFVVLPLKKTAQHLVAGTAGLSDDAVHVLNLRLGTAEGAELKKTTCQRRSKLESSRIKSYLLLRELTGTLILAVAEEFDDAALVGSEAVVQTVLAHVPTGDLENMFTRISRQRKKHTQQPP